MSIRLIAPSLLAALLAPPALAQDLVIPEVRYPPLPRAAADAAGFAPAGWGVEREVEGDLNGDGAADLAFVLRSTDPANILDNQYFGPPRFDTNPRILAVAFAVPGASGYRLVLDNHVLIPRHTMPIQEDPFSPEDSDFSFVDGTLRIALYRFSSSGGWDTGSTRFNFRWQDGALRLIGYDYDNVRRNTGCSTSLSINYLTGRTRLTAGSISDDSEETAWRRIPAGPAPTIDEVGDGFDYDPNRLVSEFPLECEREE